MKFAASSFVLGLLAAQASFVTSLTHAAQPIRLGMSYWLANVPVDVAEARGWWKEAGLELEFHRYDTTQSVLSELKAERLELASDMIGTWFDQINRGEPLVVLGETDWSHGGDKLIVKADGDLAVSKGRPIVVYLRNVAVLQFLSEYFRTRQLQLADFPIVEIADEAKVMDGFVAGRISALVSYEPFVNDLIAKGGGQVVATTADFPGAMPEGFAARRDWMATADPGTLVKFFRVWFRAVAHAKDPAHAAEVARVASAKTFNGTRTIKPEELADLLARVPLHSPAQAIAHNAPGGNLDRYRTKAQITLRLLGQANRSVEQFNRSVDVRALVEAAASAVGPAGTAQ